MDARRDTVLLVGDDRVRGILQYMCWSHVLHATSREQAARLLDEHADVIETVVVSEEVAWAKELRALLVGDRAMIRFIRLPRGPQP